VIDSLVSKIKIGYPRSGQQQDENDMSYSSCVDILDKLMVSEFSIWFRLPVDVVNDAKDYLTIIKQPIDLSEIRHKLTLEGYELIEDFELDVALLFQNCYTYNSEGSRVCDDGKSLERLFVREWTKIKDKIKKKLTGTVTQATAKMMIDLESDFLFA